MTTGRFWFEVSGTGTQQIAVELAQVNDRVAGEVVGVALRQDAGGLATAADFYLVAGPEDFDGPVHDSDVANIPEERIIFKDTGSTLTPSATACFLGPAPVGDANYHPCTSGKLYLVANVTAASGAWTFKGCIDVR